MTGGEVYVFDPEGRLPERLNDELVEAERLVPSTAQSLHALVERHVRFTGSTRAAGLLERWDDRAGELLVRAAAPRGRSSFPCRRGDGRRRRILTASRDSPQR